MATALLITRDDIVKLTALGGNVDIDKFVQFVLIAQIYIYKIILALNYWRRYKAIF